MTFHGAVLGTDCGVAESFSVQRSGGPSWDGQEKQGVGCELDLRLARMWTRAGASPWRGMDRKCPRSSIAGPSKKPLLERKVVLGS